MTNYGLTNDTMVTTDDTILALVWQTILWIYGSDVTLLHVWLTMVWQQYYGSMVKMLLGCMYD